MNINKDYEKEISIRDILFYVLYHWRSILIVMIIGAAVLGAYRYVSLSKIHKEGGKTSEEKQYEVDLQTYHDSIDNAEAEIELNSRLLREKLEYRADSILMKIDPQNEWKGVRQYYVRVDENVLLALADKTGTQDPADALLALYASTLKNKYDFESISTVLGVEKKEYVDELINITSDPMTNILSCEVIGTDEDMVHIVLEVLTQGVETIHTENAQKISAHEMELLSDEVNLQTDVMPSEKQAELNLQIVTCREKIKEAQQKLNLLEEEKEPIQPGSHIKRFIVIGAMLGAFIMALIYVIQYIISDKIHLSREISEHYNIPMLLDFYKSRARRRGKGIDWLIEKLEQRKSVYSDVDAVPDLRIFASNEENDNILLVSSLIEQQIEETDGKILEQIKKEGCKDFIFDFANNVGDFATKSADNVILLEKKGVSSEKKIERLIELLSIDKRKKIVGYIML